MTREQLTGEEFVAKYLEGRRDFHKIELPFETDLTKRIEEFNRAYDPNNPLILYGSSLRGLIAPKIKLIKAYLVEIDFSRADLRGSDFSRADLEVVDFSRADLRGSDFLEAILMWSNFRKADVSGVDFNRADVFEVDLSGVKNLGKTHNLRTAHLNHFKISSKDKETLINLLSS